MMGSEEAAFMAIGLPVCLFMYSPMTSFQSEGTSVCGFLPWKRL